VDPAALARLDATAQADLVRRGEAAPSELVEAAIARIERAGVQWVLLCGAHLERRRAHDRGRRRRRVATCIVTPGRGAP
jgi:Asp-tRNA(Asn)/Glu-tRNA(Gln) amidotransferase A subunit family amidase